MTDETVEVELDPLSGTPAADKETKTPVESSPTVDAEKDLTPPIDDGAAVQKRINKLTAEKYEAKREADLLKARVQELEGDTKPAVPAETPKLEDFDFDESRFTEASIQYQVQQQLADQATQQKQRNADDDRRKKVAAFATKEAEFGASTPDYAEVVQKLPHLHPDTLDVIYSMDNGPQMAHYLGNHLDIADEIASVSPVIAALKLGQIAATLAATTKTVETTSAPEPVETLSGAPSGVSKDLGEMSMDEIMLL